MNRIALTLVALSGAFSAAPALAQSVTDVVVMRRSVAVPNPRPKATPTPTPIKLSCPLVNSVFMYLAGGGLPPVQHFLASGGNDAVSKGRAICEATPGATGCLVVYTNPSPYTSSVYAFTAPVVTRTDVSDIGRYNSGRCTQ